MTGLLLAALLLQGGDMQVSPGSTLQSRPPATQASPLQSRVDGAAAGSRIDVPAGTYAGDLYIDRPLTLVGHGRPRLIGSGVGSVVLIRAADVTLEGFDIDGRGGGDLGMDASGIHVAAPRATIRDCRITNALFGVYLRDAPGSKVERTRVTGIKGKSAGEKGSGIHVWNTDGFELTDNEIEDVRDGLYIQSSPHGVVRRNTARNLRYGLHYMYSDDNRFEDNVFENGAAGTTLMYSRRITFRHNQFLRNRGFASVGLLFKSCDDIVAEDNLIADNARGIFIEGSTHNLFRGNVVIGSDIAIVLYDSTTDTLFTGNSFIGNLTPLSLSGRRTETRFEGNYWSDNESLDLDGNGITDQPYRLSSLFDHVRGNIIAADLVSRSLAASAVAAAEKSLPVLDALPVVDPTPLARPPVLSVPAPVPSADDSRDLAGLAASVLLLSAGLWLLAGRAGRATLARAWR
ncbi:MAG TPA: nitrous oxide reductase family maturation protein NosD [Vicinamibacterales bacterium]